MYARMCVRVRICYVTENQPFSIVEKCDYAKRCLQGVKKDLTRKRKDLTNPFRYAIMKGKRELCT